MKDKLATRVAQLSTAIRKRGNSGFATTYVYEPIDFLEVDQGSLYAVIEVVEGTGSEGLEIADLITSVLRHEYYIDLNRDPFASLEAALHQINEELSNFAGQNKVGWIGKLNAAVAVLEGRQLHVSHVGKASAHLLRSGKLTDITQGTDEKEPNPLKTFANIASGDTAAGDKVLLSVGDLFPALDQRHVGSIFAELSPARAIGTMAEELDDKEFERIGAVLIEVLTEEQLSRQYVEKDPDEIILERGGRLESLRESALPTIGGIGGAAMQAASKARDLAQGGLGGSKTPPPKSLDDRAEAHSGHKQAARENEERFHEEFDEHTPSAKAEKAPITTKLKEGSFTERAKSVGSPLVDRVERMIPSKAPKLPKANLPNIPLLNSYIVSAVLAAVLLLSVFGLSLKISHDNTAKKEVAALQKASLLEQSAGADVLVKQYSEAQQEITQARRVLTPILLSKNKTRRSEAQQISVKLSADLNLANQVTIVSATPVADFSTLNKSASTVGLTALGDYLYTADSATGAVYRFNTITQKLNQVAGGNQTHPIAATSRTGAAIFLTKTPGITEVTAGGIESVLKPTFGSWPSAVDIASFNGNLYLLDSGSGTIYKAVKTAASYANPTVSLNSSSGPSLKGSKALAIDGNIYVLLKNNTIVKFNSGNQQTFSLSALPEPLASPNEILINADLANLYILDPGTQRVVVTDETGKYLKGYSSPSWSKADGLWADENKGLIWVLSGNKLYQFPM